MLKLISTDEGPKKGKVVEVDKTTYQIHLFPFSSHAVTIFFKFVKRSEGHTPNSLISWEIDIETITGPQVNGIELDETFVRQQGKYVSYRQLIREQLEHIIYNDYGGYFHLHRDYVCGGLVIL